MPAQSSQLSEARFRTIFERSPLAIQIFSPDGRTIHVNRAWERMWNVSADSARAYNILEDPQLVDRGVMPLIHRAFNGESVTLSEVRYDAEQTFPEGYETSYVKWTRSWIYPITDETGSVREVVLTHEDVTNSKHAEE